MAKRGAVHWEVLHHEAYECKHKQAGTQQQTVSKASNATHTHTRTHPRTPREQTGSGQRRKPHTHHTHLSFTLELRTRLRVDSRHHVTQNDDNGCRYLTGSSSSGHHFCFGDMAQHSHHVSRCFDIDIAVSKVNIGPWPKCLGWRGRRRFCGFRVLRCRSEQ